MRQEFTTEIENKDTTDDADDDIPSIEGLDQFEIGSVCLEAEMLMKKSESKEWKESMIAERLWKKEIAMFDVIKRAFLRRKLKKDRLKLLLELASINRKIRMLKEIDNDMNINKSQNQNQQNQNNP